MSSFEGVIDERGQAISASQILVRGGRVSSCSLGKLYLLVWTKLQPQAFHYAFYNRILHANDVAGIGIDALAPENLARTDVKQLGRYPQTIAGAQEGRCQNGVNTQITSCFCRIDHLALILHNHRRRTDHQRSHACQFGDHCIRQRELIEVHLAIVADILKRQDRATLAFAITLACQRRLVGIGIRPGPGTT